MFFNLEAIKHHFPKEEFREGQLEAIEFALNAFNSGKKIVILECPTGSGKSAIGMTVANMVKTSYYLTITKILQDQLVDDFGDKIVELKGRNSYPCTFYDRHGQKLVDRKLWSRDELERMRIENANCTNGFCRTKWNQHGKFKCDKCFLKTGVDGKSKGDLDTLPIGMTYSACPYYEQVYKAVKASKVVMNFSSFLFQTQMTKRFEDPRDLMIIDECHNIEPQLLDFISFSISDQYLKDHGVLIPNLGCAREYKRWMKENKVVEILFNTIKEAKENGNARTEDELTKTLKRYQMFSENVDLADSEWISEYELKNNKGNHYNRVTFKPVMVKQFVNNLLFKHAPMILMMSATVLDVNVMCRSLGIDREHVAAYRVKNRFPKKNRPIYIKPVAKMTGGASKMGEWAPLLIKEVDRLVDKHSGVKGIIHTHNFAIMDQLLNKCSRGTKKRFINQRDFKDKSQMLEHHANSTDTVIVAPAMHEGINLIGDLSRFQIICKVPYPNCFDDKQLARRVEIDRSYYTWLTALKLVQSYGRSIRSPTDHAVTYILDKSIERFMSDSSSMLPDWFKEAIQR
jgi:Rad3-related DNA helicase